MRGSARGATAPWPRPAHPRPHAGSAPTPFRIGAALDLLRVPAAAADLAGAVQRSHRPAAGAAGADAGPAAAPDRGAGAVAVVGAVRTPGADARLGTIGDGTVAPHTHPRPYAGPARCCSESAPSPNFSTSGGRRGFGAPSCARTGPTRKRRRCRRCCRAGGGADRGAGTVAVAGTGRRGRWGVTHCSA